MNIFYIIFLIFALILFWRIYRNVLHPIIVTTIVWLLFPLAYEIICLTNSHYHRLSANFYIVVFFCFYIPFVIICVLMNGNVSTNQLAIRENIANPTSEDETSERIEHVSFLTTLAIIFDALLIVSLFRWAGTWNLAREINLYRYAQLHNQESFTTSVNILNHLFGLSMPLLIYIFMYKLPIKKAKIIIILLETALIEIMIASKSILIKAAVIIFCVLLIKKKLNKRNVIMLFTLMMIAMYFVTMSRDSAFVTNETMGDYIFTYLFFSLPAFDMLVSGDVPFNTSAFGSQTLGFFYRFFGKIFGTSIPEINQIHTTIPLSNGTTTANVFTSLGMYYVDFGYVGIIIYAILLAFIFSLFYKSGFVKGNKVFIVFYILEIYTLFTGFFGDVFFSYLSQPIQDLFWAFVVASPIVFVWGDKEVRI